MQPSFHNTCAFFQHIDQLLSGAEWKLRVIKVKGDLVDKDRECMGEELELWFRDPIACIKELLGNPTFKDQLCYTPEKHFTDENQAERVYKEAWQGDWWWEIQVCLSWTFLVVCK
jgi:hypothetical protein